MTSFLLYIIAISIFFERYLQAWFFCSLEPVILKNEQWLRPFKRLPLRKKMSQICDVEPFTADSGLNFFVWNFEQTSDLL